MNKSVYLDATVPSYYFKERAELTTFTDITKKWWNTQRENYDIFISDYTLAELSQGDYPNQQKIIVIPKGDSGDAFHLACASVMKIDYLLTWNCNHLANVNKERHIQILNTKLGLHVPRICTPLQLFIEKE